jgi:nitrate reductase gamma subunit
MLIYQLLALTGLAAGFFGIYLRYSDTINRTLPMDKSPVKGNVLHGILYAFTTGMMPWAKESTRLHRLAYLRGIGFHIGIFTAIGTVILSPLWAFIPTWIHILMGIVLGIGAILGAAGGVMRIADHNLRGLSLPDDHFAVWLTTLFIAVSGLGLINEAFLAPMYIVAAVTFVYVPLGKIRHCLYFFFSRVFFGRFFGRRAVFPQSVDEGRSS